MKPAVLYISYDGLLEPLGQSQVLPYLKGLATEYRIHLLTFEKREDLADAAAVSQLQHECEANNIHWQRLTYHKRPSALATGWDVLCGIWTGSSICRQEKVALVHARSYVPSLMALTLKRLHGCRFLFDMRGFWADERVDGGLWPVGSMLYRVAKWWERRFLISADCVVSLTQAAIDEMRRWDYVRDRNIWFERIPTCADLDLFHPGPRQPRAEGELVVGYVGSVGVWYLFDEVLDAFLALKAQRPAARLQILNRGGHTEIRMAMQRKHIPEDSVSLASADRAGVAAAMREMDLSIFFYQPTFSKLATAPTRLAEFLGCGVPCLVNARVGDMEATLESGNCGIAVDTFETKALSASCAAIVEMCSDPNTQARCRATALREFSLSSGLEAYSVLYRSLVADYAAVSG